MAFNNYVMHTELSQAIGLLIILNIVEGKNLFSSLCHLIESYQCVDMCSF